MDVSWKVAAGANVAYDQFPSQNQVRADASLLPTAASFFFFSSVDTCNSF